MNKKEKNLFKIQNLGKSHMKPREVDSLDIEHTVEINEIFCHINLKTTTVQQRLP